MNASGASVNAVANRNYGRRIVAETGREAFERAAKLKWPTVVLTKDKWGEYVDETLEDIHDGWILCLDAAIAKLRTRLGTVQALAKEAKTPAEYHAWDERAGAITADIAALEEMKQ